MVYKKPVVKSPRKSKTKVEEPPKKKKRIVIRKLVNGKPVPETVADQGTYAKVTVTSPGTVTINPGGITSSQLVSGTFYTSATAGTPITISAPDWTLPLTKRDRGYGRKPTPTDFRQEDLDQKELWSTAEAAWFCGVSRVTWHVNMTKTNPISPVVSGRGRGRENKYLADDVRKYREVLDLRRP